MIDYIGPILILVILVSAIYAGLWGIKKAIRKFKSRK